MKIRDILCESSEAATQNEREAKRICSVITDHVRKRLGEKINIVSALRSGWQTATRPDGKMIRHTWTIIPGEYAIIVDANIDSDRPHSWNIGVGIEDKKPETRSFYDPWPYDKADPIIHFGHDNYFQLLKVLDRICREVRAEFGASPDFEAN